MEGGDQAYKDRLGVCLAYLTLHGEGDLYYRNSLVPAASWGDTVARGGPPDRRYGVAVTEADLHAAMMALEPLLFAVARVARMEPQGFGYAWTHRWDDLLVRSAGSAWMARRDVLLTGWATKARGVGLKVAIKILVHEAAKAMADSLGEEWGNVGDGTPPLAREG